MRKIDTNALIRELTADEIQKLEGTVINPCLLIPDSGILHAGSDKEERVSVVHAYNTSEGLIYGIEYSDRKYGQANAENVKLENPKWDWQYIADKNN